MLKAALILWLLTACTQVDTDGPDAQGYRWERTKQALPATTHRGADVFLNCAQEENAISCARRDEASGTCDVYLPKRPQPWQEVHELRHCEGWTHPNPLKGM